MKIPFTKSHGVAQSPASLMAALVLVALVPAVGVLGFMSVAMRNERLAVEARLTAVYANHLAALQPRVTAFVRERQAALQAHVGGAPAETFAAIVRAKLADGVIVTDGAGKVLYPASAAAGAEMRVEETAEWARARELEFQRNDLAGAAEIYGRIVESGREANTRARAMQAQAVCWLKAGEKERALARLAELAGDASLRHAVSAQGALIGPDAQLLILKTVNVGRALRPTGLSEVSGINPDLRRTFDALVAHLNDYADAGMPANQRRFLMHEVSVLAEGRSLLAGDTVARVSRPGGPASPPDTGRETRATPEPSPASGSLPDATFPTLAAEDLAADYLEHDPPPATEAKVERVDPNTLPAGGHQTARWGQRAPPRTEAWLQRTPLAKVWRLPSTDGTVVALFREERLREELTKQLDALALPDVRVSVLAPGEAETALKRPVPTQDAGEALPGWRLALSFRDGDPLAEAAARQARFYLWMGVGVVAIIGVLAVMVARYVAAQMRLARLKDDLVSTVSHELKTPVASMRVLLDTLSAGRERDEAHRQRYLHLATKENQRLGHLVENFLVFSRLERGQQQFRFTALPPQEIVRTAIEALGEKLTGPSCRLTTHLAPDLPAIRGDVDALATVLINLLDNACKYTNGEKHIAVRVCAELCGVIPSGRKTSEDWPQKAQKAQKRNGSVLSFVSLLWPSPVSTHAVSVVVFEVTDNGIGIAPEEQRRIFDRFYQVDQSLTRQKGGCGLGLSIVQSIIRAHGGVVEVESEPGRGSLFRVKIPVANAPGEAPADAVTKPNPVDRGLHG
ncbi:MAG: hypothetical protein HZA93_02995 [Verrucomicrobia bacterium]|nr:hypothetical protein [Verrucomicrobiota bacterium]